MTISRHKKTMSEALWIPGYKVVSASRTSNEVVQMSD